MDLLNFILWLIRSSLIAAKMTSLSAETRAILALLGLRFVAQITAVGDLYFDGCNLHLSLQLGKIDASLKLRIRLSIWIMDEEPFRQRMVALFDC